jgi:hypothetical protein
VDGTRVGMVERLKLLLVDRVHIGQRSDAAQSRGRHAASVRVCEEKDSFHFRYERELLSNRPKLRERA